MSKVRKWWDWSMAWVAGLMLIAYIIMAIVCFFNGLNERPIPDKNPEFYFWFWKFWGCLFFMKVATDWLKEKRDALKQHMRKEILEEGKNHV